jgi:hypothetical protein
LKEGESLLASGCVSHTYFEFYFHAIELSLSQQRWSDVKRYADSLAQYTSEESVPWADLIIQRGRLLAQIGAEGATNALIDQLRVLRAGAHARDLGLSIPAMDAVLAQLK